MSNNAMKDNKLERYLDGKMEPAEKEAFLNNLDSPEELMTMMQADDLITNTIVKDQQSLLLGQPEPSAGLQAMLANTRPILQPSGLESAGGSVGTSGTGMLGTWFAKSIVALVGIAGVTIGVFVIAPFISGNNSDVQPVGTQPVAPMEHQQTVSPHIPELPPINTGIQQADREGSVSGHSVYITTEQPKARTQQPHEAIGPAATRNSANDIQQGAALSTTVQEKQVPPVPLQPFTRQSEGTTPVITNDKAHVEIQLQKRPNEQ